MDLSNPEPTRAEIDRLTGPVMLEFGASWCGHCLALRPHVDALLAEFADVHYIWVEDGKGKPLGRSFRVKWWPTLVFLRDGKIMHRLERPEPTEVRESLEMITSRPVP